MPSASEWFYELRQTVRQARQSKAFYVGVVLLLAIGMAGATVMVTLIRGIVLRPMPVADEHRLVVSWLVPRSGLATHLPYRAEVAEELDRSSQSFTRVAGVGYNGATEQAWTDGRRPFSARTAVVMGGFFDVVGVRPRLGRGLADQDDQTGAERQVVLSHRLWRRAFAASTDVIGRVVSLDRESFTVAGVMPPDFEYPSGAELWVTRHALAQIEPNEAFRTGLLRDVDLVARLREGVTVDQARQELAVLAARLDETRNGAGARGFQPVVQSFKRAVIGDVDTALAMLLAAVGVLLAIAIANATNLFVLRADDRRQEFAVRAALGASRGRLVGLLLMDASLVAAAATITGLAVAWWALPLIVRAVPEGLPRPESIYIDGVAATVAIVIGVVATLCAGIVPGLMAMRADISAGLRSRARGAAGSGSTRGRRVLVAVQVALAIVVVTSAVLLARSLQRLTAIDMGLRADHLLLAELELPPQAYADRVRRQQFFDAVLARLRAHPRIDAATPINTLPFAGPAGWDVPEFTGEGQTDADVVANPPLNFEVVTADYFETLGVPIVRGRGFTDADRRDGLPVAIVSEAVAARVWPGQDAVGQRLKFGRTQSSRPWLTVVGVAATTRYRELATPRPTLYLPADQFMFAFGRLAIRSVAEPSMVAATVREAVAAVDASVLVPRVAPFSEHLDGPLAWPRFYTLLFTVFAVTSLALAAMSLFAVVSASVRQRRREFGVRMALGATTQDITGLVLREALVLALAGVLLGLALTLVVTRMLRGLLYETSAIDPPSLVAAVLLLVGGALAASWLPARRAARLDPMAVLRAE